MTKISVIHPSRQRPQKAASTYMSWSRKCDNPNNFEWILSLDTDDNSNYFGIFQSLQYHMPDDIVQRQNKSAVDAINHGAEYAEGKIIMVVSDDTDCIPSWDTFLLKWLNGKNDFICKVADGIQPWIITMPIMDRTYYNRFGYIYHPDYQHMFCDTELTCVADLTGRKITSDILFKHNHYSVTKEQPDAVNKKADATWTQGEKLFLERYKRNFDLKPEDIKGKIQDNGMIQWLQRKNR